jgi:hypothetical protein
MMKSVRSNTTVFGVACDDIFRRHIAFDVLQMWSHEQVLDTEM